MADSIPNGVQGISPRKARSRPGRNPWSRKAAASAPTSPGRIDGRRVRKRFIMADRNRPNSFLLECPEDSHIPDRKRLTEVNRARQIAGGGTFSRLVVRFRCCSVGA
ncbi:hypothetical protein MTBSS4_130074 [Magnetospirillum sp. SS-4]|nr:hypothetical protein MTBSS4_130074 [Magnetospirillum sp. SS-4]